MPEKYLKEVNADANDHGNGKKFTDSKRHKFTKNRVNTEIAPSRSPWT